MLLQVVASSVEVLSVVGLISKQTAMQVVLDVVLESGNVIFQIGLWSSILLLHFG